MWDIRDHRDRGTGSRDIGCDQDNAGQGCIHHAQVVIANGLPLPLQVSAVIEHALHDLVGVLVNVLFHQRHACRCIERALLTEDDFMAQHVVGHAVGGKKILVQTLFVAGAEVQFPAQGFELLDADFVLETFYCEVSGGIGAGNEFGVGAEGLAVGKIMQRRIKQGEGAAASA
ncbi:hypothetical protein D3C87_1154540 [compost metagenome]